MCLGSVQIISMANVVQTEGGEFHNPEILYFELMFILKKYLCEFVEHAYLRVQ